MLRLLARPGKVVTVTVLPPYSPSPEEAVDATLFAANCRRAMAAALGVPLEERAGVEDARAFYASQITGYEKTA